MTSALKKTAKFAPAAVQERMQTYAEHKQAKKAVKRVLISKEEITRLLEQQVVTQRNTLLVSALPYSGNTQEYLLGAPVSDVVQSPVAMGTINETLAARPSALRSLHPTHSVVALGPEAAQYTANHHLDRTPFGEHSPYYKLIVRRGKAPRSTT